MVYLNKNSVVGDPMFRTMIVEDEMLVRLGLKNSIDWNKFNMTVIADAADGQAAWEIYQKEKPDLIITDLKMPVMDGMELITRIREKDKKTKIIILSCLEEFDIARKAMSFGVSDYILKLTMTEEEMETVLKKAQEELEKQVNENQSRHKENLKKDFVKEKFLEEFLFYNIYSLKEFTAYVKEAELRLNPGRLVLCTMEIDHFEILKDRFQDEKGQLIKSALLNILNEIMGNYGRGEAFCDNNSCYILIFSFYDITSEQNVYNELQSILNAIKNAINSYLNVYVSFGVSSLRNEYAFLGMMYRESRKMLEQKFFSGTGTFLAGSVPDFDRIAAEKINSLRSLPKLLKILGDSAVKDYQGKVDAFAANGPKEKEQIQTFFHRLLQWLSSLLYTKDDYSTDFARVYNERIEKSETLDEAVEAFKGFIADTTNEAMKKRILSREVAEALQYIQNNYSSDINLSRAAEHVRLSPNYLGNLFKKELQVNFVEYLNELRVGKAKELLLGTYLKSYEIAEKVGFTENTYFCRVFKKVTGMSPNEFRKHLMKEWSEELEDEDIQTPEGKK